MTNGQDGPLPNRSNPEAEHGPRLAQRQPLSSSVYDVVVDMLLTRELSQGARLNIEELPRMLGVSPTPVREALARVEAEGLISKEPQRGYPVAPVLGLPRFFHLIELRILIEPPAAPKAAKRTSAAQTSALHRDQARAR